MTVEPLSSDTAAEWDAAVEQFPEAWLYHTTPWVGIESASAKSQAFLVRLDGRVVALCPMYLERWRLAKVLPVTVLHSGRARGGPALAPHLSPRERRSAYAAVFGELDRVAGRQGVDRLYLRLPTLAPAFLPPDRPASNPLAVVRPLAPIRYGGDWERGELVTKIADLSVGVDALFAGLDHNCRKAIRKSHSSGLEIVEADCIDLVRVYHDIHLQSFAHSGAVPASLADLERMWRALHPAGRLGLFLGRLDGHFVAGLLALRFKTAATYWGGSSLVSARHARPNNALMWHAMQWASRHGCRWFELGPTFPTLAPGSKAGRIGRFKDQFGGTLYAAFEGVHDPRPLKMAIFDLVDGAARAWIGRRERATGDDE